MENLHSPLAQSPGIRDLAERYNVTPYAGLVWDPRDREVDDHLHDPKLGKNDEGKKEKRKWGCGEWTRRGMVNVGGLVLIVVGLLMLLVGYPVMWVSWALKLLVMEEY